MDERTTPVDSSFKTIIGPQTFGPIEPWVEFDEGPLQMYNNLDSSVPDHMEPVSQSCGGLMYDVGNRFRSVASEVDLKDNLLGSLSSVNYIAEKLGTSAKVI